MTEAAPCAASAGEAPAPYDALYVYYIEGRVPRTDVDFGDHFIGAWEEDGFSFLFFSKPARERVKRLTDRAAGLRLLDQYQMTYDQWHGDSVAPFRTRRMFIHPPWAAVAVPGDLKGVLLDPGVVFGSGLHPTTRDCLDLLEELFSETRIASALDLGTGTGLLALAAARLGCRKTLAADVNFLAAQTARKNIRLNGLEDRILAVQGRAEDLVSAPADLLMANIHYDVMKRIITREALENKRWLILSGLFRSEEREIRFQLEKYSVKIIAERKQDDIWHTCLGRI